MEHLKKGETKKEIHLEKKSLESIFPDDKQSMPEECGVVEKVGEGKALIVTMRDMLAKDARSAASRRTW